jgi:hypothetical protein
MIPAKLQLVIAVPLLSTLAMAPALSGDGYSFEEQEACTSDAFRLCSEFIPNVNRITTCMQAKQDQLSPRCAKMFAPDRDRHLNDPDQRPREAEHPSRNQPPRDLQSRDQVQPPRNQTQPRIPAQRRDFDDPPDDKPLD